MQCIAVQIPDDLCRPYDDLEQKLDHAVGRKMYRLFDGDGTEAVCVLPPATTLNRLDTIEMNEKHLERGEE